MDFPFSQNGMASTYQVLASGRGFNSIVNTLHCIFNTMSSIETTRYIQSYHGSFFCRAHLPRIPKSKFRVLHTRLLAYQSRFLMVQGGYDNCFVYAKFHQIHQFFVRCIPRGYIVYNQLRIQIVGATLNLGNFNRGGMIMQDLPVNGYLEAIFSIFMSNFSILSITNIYLL